MKSIEDFYTRVNSSIAEEISVAQTLEDSAAQSRFAAKYADWGFDEDTWRVFWVNTLRMRSVTRKTGEPYATHPTRMAMLALGVIGRNPSGQKSARICLLHDYLEEGDGVSFESIQKLKEDLAGQSPAARMGAVLLTEPLIDYSQYPRPRRWMEQVSYVLQVRTAYPRLLNEHFNSIFLDKIDNGHDWRYIVENADLSEERRRARLIQKLGHFSFVAEAFADRANLKLLQLLRKTITDSAREFAITKDEVRFVKVAYENTLVEHRESLSKAIDQYWSDLGIKEQQQPGSSEANASEVADSSDGGD